MISPTEEGSTPQIPCENIVSVPPSVNVLSENLLKQQIKTRRERLSRSVDDSDSMNKHIVGLTVGFV